MVYSLRQGVLLADNGYLHIGNAFGGLGLPAAAHGNDLPRPLQLFLVLLGAPLGVLARRSPLLAGGIWAGAADGEHSCQWQEWE
jgi:hypothetical protein